MKGKAKLIDFPKRPNLPCLLIALALPAALFLGCRHNGQSSGTTSETQDKQTPENGLLSDVTSESGMDFLHDAYRQGEFLFPEINGAGCGFLDFDNDGFLDLYVPSGYFTAPKIVATTTDL